MKRPSFSKIVHRSAGGTPIVLLAVSAGVSTAARGDELVQNDLAEAVPTAFDLSLKKARESMESGVWHMPMNGDKKTNSDFLQKLLLSHGIQIDLDQSEYLDSDQFAQTFKQGPRDAVTVGDVDLSMLVEMDTLLSMPKPVSLADVDVSDQWEVVWLDFAGDESFNEATANQEAKEALEKKLIWSGSQWQLDILISRRATDAEIAAMQEQGQYPRPLDSDNAPLPLMVGREPAATYRKERTPEKGVLRRWLATLPLDANLDDDCSVQDAIISQLKNSSDKFTKLRTNQLTGENLDSGGVSRDWEARWLDCDVDFDLGDAPEPDSQALPTVIDEPPRQSTFSIDPQAGRPALQTDMQLPDFDDEDDFDEEDDFASIDTADSGLPIYSQGEAVSDLPSSTIGDEPSGIFGFGDDVPAGFENLGGPQTSFVDVYFNDRKIGTTSITATPEVFTFDQPVDVAAMLTGIKPEAAMHVLLAETFDTNGHLICYSQGDPPGCGIVEPNPVAAIYDEAELKVEIFVAPELQSVQALERLRYLPVPGENNSTILSLSAVGSKLEGEVGALDVSGRMLFGFGRGNISAVGDYSSVNNLQRLRELKGTKYFNDYELEVGTYSHSPGGALTDMALLGGSFSTSYKSRIDLERAFASELIVFLTRRSVVQIAIDGRVYTGSTYDAGNQVLDTTALPDGVYQIELRILDPVTGPRTETRAFTKSAQIPPKGESVIGFTAGNVIEYDEFNSLPLVSDVAVFGAYRGTRINDNSALRLGVLQFGTQSFFQTEAVYLGERTSLSLGASVGDDKTLASSFRAAYTQQGVSLNLAGSAFSSEFNPAGDTVYERMFPTDYQQVSVSLGKAFPKFSTGVRSSYRKEFTGGAVDGSQQYSLFYRQPVFRTKHTRGFINADIQQDEVEKRMGVQFNLYFGRNQWSGGVNGAVQRVNSNGISTSFGANADWNPSTEGAIDWRAGAYVGAEESNNSVGAQVDLEHPWFTAGASTGWNEAASGVSSQNTVATFSAQVGLDQEGGAIGGSDFSQAGLIIDIDGKPAGAGFDVYVNNIKYASGEIGAVQFIGLQAFQQYTVKIVPQTTLSNGLGEEIYEFTLYPGSVERISLSAQREIMLVGTLVDEAGDLIANALLQLEPSPLIVDGSGYVQAELAPGKVVPVKLANGSYCEFTVPDSPDEDILVMAEPIVCKAIANPE